MNLLDFCNALHEDYIICAINRGEIVFHGPASTLGTVSNIDLDTYEAQRFIIRNIELNSVRYEADIVVSGQIY